MNNNGNNKDDDVIASKRAAKAAANSAGADASESVLPAKRSGSWSWSFGSFNKSSVVDASQSPTASMDIQGGPADAGVVAESLGVHTQPGVSSVVVCGHCLWLMIL